MDLRLSEEQQLIKNTARDFARHEVAPRAKEIDEQHRYPEELVRQMAELGFMGVSVPESDTADSIERALAIATKLGYPVMVRAGFSLGGLRRGGTKPCARLHDRR